MVFIELIKVIDVLKGIVKIQNRSVILSASPLINPYKPSVCKGFLFVLIITLHF